MGLVLVGVAAYHTHRWVALGISQRQGGTDILVAVQSVLKTPDLKTIHHPRKKKKLILCKQGLGFRLILCFLEENNNSESFWEIRGKVPGEPFGELLNSRGTFWRTFAECKDPAPQMEGSQ